MKYLSKEDGVELQKIKEIEKLLRKREDILTEFDEELFSQMVDKVSVISLVGVEFVYKMRCEITEIL